MDTRTTTGSMTIMEFYKYCDKRPDIKKIELIGGKPVVNASPSDTHAKIVSNVLFTLLLCERQTNADWTALPDIGVRIAENERLEPDVVVVPGNMTGKRDREDAIVVFEVLSPSTRKKDLGPKRVAYISLPTVTHYVAIEQRKTEVIVFARDNGFKRETLKSSDDVLTLPSIGAKVSLAEIYRGTGL